MKKILTFGLLCSTVICTALAVSCDDKPQPQTYSVTITDDGNGTATANPEAAPQGTLVTITATPAEGYVFDKWTVTDRGVELSDRTANPATFSMPARDVEIKAEFESQNAPEYTIAITVTGEGTAEAFSEFIDGAPVTQAAQGTKIYLNAAATPGSGHIFDKWTVVGGGARLADQTQAHTHFTMPAENVEIRAEFKPSATEPVNHIRIDGGEKQEILSSIYAIEQGAGYAFAVSPMCLTDRTADVMEKRFVFFVPQELMDKEVDVATDNLKGGEWYLVVNLCQSFLDRARFECDYSTTGTFKVIRGQDDNFTIDFTDFRFGDGSTVSMHYEGRIDKKASYDDFLHYTAVLATYDIRIGDEVIDVQTTGYIQTKTGADGGAMLSNIWGYIDEPYAFFDLYLTDSGGGIFTGATYAGTGERRFDGAFETDNMSDFFMEDNSGTVTLSKTATTVTITFSEVPMLFDEEMVLDGTITCDVGAPLPTAARAGRIPGRVKNLRR